MTPTIETKVLQSMMSPISNYQALHSKTNQLHITNQHLSSIDQATLGGNAITNDALAPILGAATKLSASRGVVPLADNGRSSYSNAVSQYQQRRYVVQISVAYRSPAGEGEVCLFGFTDREEFNGRLPDDLVITFNSVSIYAVGQYPNGSPRREQLYAGRIQGTNPLAPRQNNENTNTMGPLSRMMGNEGGGMEYNDYGRITASSIGSNLASAAFYQDNAASHSSELINLNDVSHKRSMNGTSFNTNSTSEVISGFLTGYVSEAQSQSKRWNDARGQWVESEDDMMGGKSPMYHRWLQASTCGGETALTNNRLLMWINDSAPQFANTGQLSWGTLKRVFNGIDDATEILSQGFHEEMENIYNLTADTENLNSRRIEASLADRIAELVPSCVATQGYTRYSFMLTNRTNNNRCMCSTLGNIFHPHLNRDPENLNRVNEKVNNAIMRNLDTILSDCGNRPYEVEVHYSFRADVRIYINLGGGRRQYIRPNFPDRYSNSAVSFNFSTDVEDTASNIRGIAEGLGVNPVGNHASASLSQSSNWGGTSNTSSDWGKPSTQTNKFKSSL